VEAAVTIAALPVASVVLWALLGTPAIGARLVAHPSGERWHDRATPTFGGVGIAFGLVAGIGLAALVGAVADSWELGGIVAGAIVVFAAGLIDDVWHLSPLAKLAAQFAAAGIALAAGLRVELVANDVIGIVVALVWLVGITNAFNLLDNMDGLAATLATVACAYFAVDAATVHENDLVLVTSLALGFACLGFLPFNLRPGGSATVFMGDSGSQAIGFTLAALGLASSWTTAGTTVATMALPLLVLAVPILDTSLVTVRRLREGRPVSQGGRDHSSHRLVYYGLSELRAVALLTLLAVVLGATAVAYNVLDRPSVTALGVLLTFALLVQFGGFLSELSEQSRTQSTRNTSLRQAVTFDGRRLAEVLIDFVLLCAAYLLAFLPFVSGGGTELQRGTFQAVLPILVGTTYVVFVLVGVYRRAWRYATVRDLAGLGLATVLATIVAFGAVVATRDLGDFSPGVFALHAVLAAGLVTAARITMRWLPAAGRGREGTERRILLVGAGRQGRALARELRRTRDVRVVGFLDDDVRLHRRRVHGAPVLGTLADAPAVLQAIRADELRIAIGDVLPGRLTELEVAAAAAVVPCSVVRRETPAARRMTSATAE